MREGLQGKTTRGVSHVCMPVLYLWALVFLRAWRNQARLHIHYEILPRYMRGICRCLGVSHDRMAAMVSRLIRLPVQKIRHGNEIEGYGELRFDAMNRVVDIAADLAKLIEKNQWTTLLSALIGQTPAVAYTLKNLSHYQLHLPVLALSSCYKSLGSAGKPLFVGDPGWPKQWVSMVRHRLQVPFVSFEWPEWYLRLYRLLAYFSIFVRLPLLTVAYALRQGIAFHHHARKHFKVATEFIDPLRLSQKPFDADYLVDGTSLQASDLLLFLTREQQKMLSGYGYETQYLVKAAAAKNYELAVLSQLSISGEMLWFLARLYFRALTNHAGDPSVPLGYVFLMAWLEYLEYQPLFDHYDVENVVYLPVPHGRTGWRKNSALITGIARPRGVRVFGCQTRVVDTKQYEHAFECFDAYFSWGKGWQEVLEGTTAFMGRLLEVGCIHLDALIPTYHQFQASHGARAVTMPGPAYVSIFTGDVDVKTSVFGGSFYPLGYILTFLESCLKLALVHREIQFVVKTKDPDHVELILQQSRFRKLQDQVGDNFTFEKRPRCEYLDLIAGADIVLAIGFTSPGIEGLFLGKRVIYYSNLGRFGECFKSVPDLVAENDETFGKLFLQALQDYKDYAAMHQREISRLEPFRDGRARERILTWLNFEEPRRLQTADGYAQNNRRGNFTYARV